MVRGGWRPRLRKPPPSHSAPLVRALVAAAAAARARFFFPGHKGALPPAALPPSIRRPYALDLPELDETGTVADEHGPTAEAQRLAAAAFGAERTWFLANGSTAGVLASLFAAVVEWHRAHPQGQGVPRVILPRNAHKSALNALRITGARPRWVAPGYDAQAGITLGVAAADIAQALAEESELNAAVFVVSPTYHGVASDIEAIAAHASAAGVTFIVDEAHGAHLGFLETRDEADASADGDVLPLPFARPALSLGADIAIHSTHKVLCSLTQSAMLHTSAGDRSSLAQSLDAAVDMFVSSSPSYLLLASLDAARWQVDAPSGGGRVAMRRALNLAQWARLRIEGRPHLGVRVFAPRLGPACVAVDPLRLTLLVADGSGLALDAALTERGVYCELADAGSLTFALSAGTTRRSVRHLVRALAAAAPSGGRADEDTGVENSVIAELDAPTLAPLTPREATLRKSEPVPIANAAGRIAAEMACVYPPGIPLLIPGEQVTKRTVASLLRLRAAGSTLYGLSDPSLETLHVVSYQTRVDAFN